jgi:hypothetical protein
MKDNQIVLEKKTGGCEFDGRILVAHTAMAQPSPSLSVTQTSLPSPPPSPSPKSTSFQYFLADAADRATPAVVRVYRHLSNEGAGSGFLVSKDGLLVTNCHVIFPGRYGVGGDIDYRQIVSGNVKVNIGLSDGRTLPATLKGFDEKFDIAVLQIDRTGMGDEEFPYVELGCSRSLRVGEWVMAVGAPLNLGKTVTAGIVSNLGRIDSELGQDNQGANIVANLPLDPPLLLPLFSSSIHREKVHPNGRDVDGGELGWSACELRREGGGCGDPSSGRACLGVASRIRCPYRQVPTFQQLSSLTK